MNIMPVIDVVITVFGLYMVISALKMKRSGALNALIVTKEEADACKNPEAFITFIYWKEALFGGILALVGILGLVNELLVSLGYFKYVELVLFLAVFAWFWWQLQKARRCFL